MFMHRSPAWQSAVVEHGPEPNASAAQKQAPSVVTEQRQPSPHAADTGVHPVEKHDEQGELHAEDTVCANAGMRKLVSTGADHAIAAPAPIRLSILRRDIPSGRSISSILPSPFWDPEPSYAVNPATVMSGSPDEVLMGHVPHGATHTLSWQPFVAERQTHPDPNMPWQSAVVVQLVASLHRSLLKQKQSFGPVTVSEQWQVFVAGPQSAPTPQLARPGHGPTHAPEVACANAGIRRLVRTGADQAIAAPAPIRLSMRRREISFRFFSL